MKTKRRTDHGPDRYHNGIHHLNVAVHLDLLQMTQMGDSDSASAEGAVHMQHDDEFMTEQRLLHAHVRRTRWLWWAWWPDRVGAMWGNNPAISLATILETQSF